MEKKNMQVVLNNHVKGHPKETDFSLETSLISFSLSHGSVLLKNLYLACDPYMRHRMLDHGSELGTLLQNNFLPGSVIVGYGVAKVIQSANSDLMEGDIVWGITGWEQYTMLPNSQGLNKINYTHLPLSYYASILGMPGIAAYFGFFDICSPKEGDTVYVSSAAGGVGQLVGQFAKMKGCYVVGSASTQEKVELITNKFGFDGAFNYKKAPDLGSCLKEHFPKGIDIYFDNVGGKMLDEVLLHMKPNGRISACGMISQYNLEKPEGIHNIFNLIIKRIQMKGFIETDYKNSYAEYLEFAVKCLQDEKIVYVEDIGEGLQNAASALVGIFHGRNVGKQVVRVASE